MRTNRIILNVIIATIVGLSLCLMIKVISAPGDLESNIVYVAEMSENVLPGQIITAESLLSDFPEIRRSTVRVVSASEALESMKEEMPEIKYVSDNPFRNNITFRTKGIHLKDLKEFESKVLELGGVEALYYDRAFVSTLSESLSRVRIGAFIFCLLLLFGSLVALALRIKRDIVGFAKDVKILSLAGAEESQIINSRVVWSTKWGGISALIASVICVINIFFINNTLLNGLEITLLQSLLAICLMILVVTGAHALVTLQSLKSYLSKINPSITS